MNTTHEILARHDIPTELVDDLTVPALACLQVQGDVAVIPTRPSAKPGTPIPSAGIPVVRGENGGNTHLLVGDGTWAESTAGGAELGVLTVPPGGVAWLLHPEHGANGIGPGCFLLRRQREQADELRLVAD